MDPGDGLEIASVVPLFYLVVFKVKTTPMIKPTWPSFGADNKNNRRQRHYLVISVSPPGATLPAFPTMQI